MEKIKIRMSMIIWSVAVLALIGIIIYSATPYLMYEYAERQSNKGNLNTANLVRERIIDYFPASSEARSIAYSTAMAYYEGGRYIITGQDFFGPTWVGVEKYDPEIVLKRLERISLSESSRSKWEHWTNYHYAMTYKHQGNLDLAEKYFINVPHELSNQYNMEHYPHVDWIELRLMKGDYIGAIEHADAAIEIIDNPMSILQTLLLKGQAYILLNQFDKAVENFQQSIEIYENRISDELYLYNNDYHENLNTIEDLRPWYYYTNRYLNILMSGNFNTADDIARISGTVTVAGNPGDDIEIYLMDPESEIQGSDFYREVPYLFKAKTDPTGSFAFHHVPPGRYIGVLGVKADDLVGIAGVIDFDTVLDVEPGGELEVDYSLIEVINITRPEGELVLGVDDKAEIRWEPIKGAASYNLNIVSVIKDEYSNSYRSIPFKEGIMGSNIEFSFAELPRITSGIISSNGIVHPAYVVGVVHPGAEFHVIVEALDPNGRVISNNEGYTSRYDANLPIIRVDKGMEISEGDRLMLDWKHLEARDAYLRALEKESNDIDALLSLARLHHNSNNQEGFSEEEAYYYYARVAELASDLYIIEECAGYFKSVSKDSHRQVP